MKKPTVNTSLIWTMASVQATRYARAFVLTEAMQHGVTGILALDGVLRWSALGGGFLMGAGVSFGIAHVASTWKGMKLNTTNGKTASRDARNILIGVLLVSPFVLAPTAGAWSTWEWWRAVLLAFIPDLLVAALAFVDPAKPTTQTAKPAGRRPQTTTQTAKPAAQHSQTTRVYECNWPGCDWTTEQSKAVERGGDPQSALAAHISHHNRTVRKIEAEKQKAERT